MPVAEAIAGFVLWAQALIASWGYLGIFFVNIIGSATIILPILPAFAVVFLTAAELNPWLVGVFAGAGAAIGEITGYLLGKGGGRLAHRTPRKYERWVLQMERWVAKHGIFPVIVLFAAAPLPADVIGIFAGLSNYDVRKFLLANFIGKTIKFTLLAWAGALSINWILHVFG